MVTQSEINIGLVGHVDHGKTTLTKALSGIWTDKHSEEIKKGISIRLGYADCTFYKCPKCDEPECYCTQNKCPRCGQEAKILRKVSFVDSPGHETLMATMLSGAALMDGALLVIAANEPCPQPQTAEHLMALDSMDVKNVVIAQNKIDLVSKDEAIKNQQQIREFVGNSIAKDSPIIPIAAHYGANIDVLIKAIQDHIPTPKRNLEKSPRMYVARSFDINKPGSKIQTLKGAVIGGSVIQGTFKIGDAIELKPGIRVKNNYIPLMTEVASLNAGGSDIDEAAPGGLIAIGTKLDPSLSKADNLSGNLVGKPGTLPEIRDMLNLKVKLFDTLVGSREKDHVKPLQKDEPLMLSVGTSMTVGYVTNPKTGELKLKLPICADAGSKVAISRRFETRWRLIGYGIIE
ncbi:MAG: translation initiation factor IF-2 subunit gamma [Candidatus Altiarchaeota archaeon]